MHELKHKAAWRVAPPGDWLLHAGLKPGRGWPGHLGPLSHRNAGRAVHLFTRMEQGTMATAAVESKQDPDQPEADVRGATPRPTHSLRAGGWG